VQEEELEAVVAQRVYKMRCGCGRSWFELQLKTLVTCPACRKRGLVTPDHYSKTTF
jgi:DNA-directed RNA polymerase subunit RPC12/RpoP